MTSDPSTVITSLSGHVLVERYLAAGQRLAQEPRYHTGGTTVDALVAAARDGWALSNGEGEGLTAVRAAARIGRREAVVGDRTPTMQRQSTLDRNRSL